MFTKATARFLGVFHSPGIADDRELLTHEDLEQLHFEELERLIEWKPELAVAAAYRAGWTFRPNDAEADIQRALGNVP